MNIYRAVKRALKKGKLVKREFWKKGVYLKPTNSHKCCLLITPKATYKGWQPLAKDLTETDWVIVDEP